MAGPGRPATDADMLRNINGAPKFLGQLASANANTPVNNATTAKPFNYIPLGPNTNPSVGPPNLTNTLAGKVLLIQVVANSYILPATFSSMIGPDPVIEANTGVINPGVRVPINTSIIITMLPTEGWLMCLAVTAGGTIANVWELR